MNTPDQSAMKSRVPRPPLTDVSEKPARAGRPLPAGEGFSHSPARRATECAPHLNSWVPSIEPVAPEESGFAELIPPNGAEDRYPGGPSSTGLRSASSPADSRNSSLRGVESRRAGSRASALALLVGALAFLPAKGADTTLSGEVEELTVDGNIDREHARLVIEARLKGGDAEADQPIYAARVRHTLVAGQEGIDHEVYIDVEVVKGKLDELFFRLQGTGQVTAVHGDAVEVWGVRTDAQGMRSLIVIPRESETPYRELSLRVIAKTDREDPDADVVPLAFAPRNPALASGYLKVTSVPDLEASVRASTGLTPLEAEFAPKTMRHTDDSELGEPEYYRFYGSSYTLDLAVRPADPEARQVVVREFKLVGDLSDKSAAFELTATASVKNPKGGWLDLLAGGYALTEIQTHPDWKPVFQDGRLRLRFEEPGDYPIHLRFNAAVNREDDWNRIDFRVVPSALQPVALRGLKADTEFQVAEGARMEREGDLFASHLPANGRLDLRWKAARPEVEGRLFYSVEAFRQIIIGPGLMREMAVLDFKVMQGELSQVALSLSGEGEVTRVSGRDVLSWRIESNGEDGQARRLVVDLNQPQKDQFALQVQTQRSLGAFPQSVAAPQLRPEAATRYGGYYRIVNDGAVRLEVLEARGLSQISPEQLPETAATRGLTRERANQVFAFRFSGSDFQLQIQADNVLPELSVSEVLSYHVGETELVIEGEIELDIREAPLRELHLRVPTGFVVSRLEASNLSDYFVTPETGEETSLLRLVYGQPSSGRQVIQLRLERNNPLGESAWQLPRVAVLEAKSTRGHIGVSADAGFRITPAGTAGLTEIATAFFPKQVENIQAAFRLSDPGWEASVGVERLAQTIRAESFHLFSIGEGIAYGSSVMNYLVSGAPISVLRVALSDGYYNLEFTGKEVRNWQKTEEGYEVYLHTPTAGDYTLLASYERPFKPQGETLSFAGAQPLDAQSEQGYTIVISTFQFQVEPVDVSPGLLPLEPGEVPATYRLFFDAPILAAYQYTSRPFNLQVALKPLAQGETLGQVIDRATLSTRVSEEGQVLTKATYFVKNKGLPHLRMVVPEGTRLWSATVDGATVVPVADEQSALIPLPRTSDPNAVNVLELNLASKSKSAKRVAVAAPSIEAPVLLTEWDLTPDTGRRLVFRGGTLTPASVAPDVSGFAGVLRFLNGNRSAAGRCFAVLGLLVVAVLAWRWASAKGTKRYDARHLTGAAIGAVALVIALLLIWGMALDAGSSGRQLPTSLRFVAPVQEAGSPLNVELRNLPTEWSKLSLAWRLWPVVFGLVAWVLAFAAAEDRSRRMGVAVGWTLIFWGVLRWPNAAPAFFGLVVAFVLVGVVVPGIRTLAKVRSKPEGNGPTGGGAPLGATAILLGGLLLSTGDARAAAQHALVRSRAPATEVQPLAQSVVQRVRVEKEFVRASADIQWRAEKDEVLDLLFHPAVLTRIDFPQDALRLVRVPGESGLSHRLIADRSGTHDIELAYEVRVTDLKGQSGFRLPTQHGLINRLELELVDRDMDVVSAGAVSVERLESDEKAGTRAKLILSPVNGAWIGWQPRSRDVRKETAVFFAELYQLYVPSAGVVDGVQAVQIRPARGELSELSFDVPEGSTITDVATPALAFWRFDPDERRLRVTLNPSQAKPFTVAIRSQIAATPLPYEQRAGLISVRDAAEQVGLVGVATGREVQLDDVSFDQLSPIDLEDFPASVLEPLQAGLPGLTLRRAYRYGQTSAFVTLKAAAVLPDIRVTSRQTLSLGEDRTLLAANLKVNVTRAGIFKLSFPLPDAMDVESVSGSALSHWTELKSDTDRIITLHLVGKTEGEVSFDLSLTGPGLKTVGAWSVPRLSFREAAKQQGQIVIVPEQGMRLRGTLQEGATQLDPAQAGIRQKGVLAYRLLQADWRLTLDVEQVESWIQVASLQHVLAQEGQVQVSANLNYQIENTGVKVLHVQVPAEAESVAFRGDQVSDFLRAEEQPPSGGVLWEVKLHRRMIGRYTLEVSYTLRTPEEADLLIVRGLKAADANLQRGFLTLQGQGRLQVVVNSVPDTLRATAWEAVPRALRRGAEAPNASHVFRLVEAGFELPVKLDRHEAAKLLPAQVENISLTSVISDDAVVLTRVLMEVKPGDKRVLRLTLPEEAKLWFAFVNQSGVWLWQEDDQVLIPLEPPTAEGSNTIVEFYYAIRAGRATSRSLDLRLLGPQFDLPLQEIAWQVYLDRKWSLEDWDGSLQLQDEGVVAQPGRVDISAYIQNEKALKQQQTQQAEQLLDLGNTVLQQGDQQQARLAFKNAFALSQHDAAFNEDARVQLRNLRTQQALIGLNYSREAARGDADAVGAQLMELRDGELPVYTQEEAKRILQQNTGEENGALLQLAERLVEQQESAGARPTAIRATIPERGRLLTFKRSLQVDTWSDLLIEIEAGAAQAGLAGSKLLMLGSLFVLLYVFSLRVRRSNPTAD